MQDFQSLGLSKKLLLAVEQEGYTTPTPVQAQAIPPLLDGRDVLGVAQTGTGKTAAFALPVLQIISRAKPQSKRHIRALVLSPTCLLYTSPSPRDLSTSRMPSSA